MDKIWQVAERRSDDLWQDLVLARDLTSFPDYFSPNVHNLSSPWSLWQMKPAVERIVAGIESQQPMVVWGDFDCDGVTSTAILWETLHQLGAQVMPYIPVRDTEGHGFSDSGLQKLASDGVKLIVTVDHGITAFDGVERARQLGMDVVVSDHHEPKETGRHDGKTASVLSHTSRSSSPPGHTEHELPNCVAVVHPELSDNKQPLAGCGVSYQLAYAVWLTKLNRDDDQEAREEFAKQRIGLAALGTIADMVPLRGDNRIFASVGLKQLAQTERIGLQMLMQNAGLRLGQPLRAYDVGFVLGPRLNAPGRLAEALDSLRLLCTKDEDRAGKLANHLDALNTERQLLLARVAEQAVGEARNKGLQGAYVLARHDWPAGVCGLVAGKVVEAMYRPTVVMEERGDISRGSARSIKGFDITAGLTNISDLLESFGGHAMAAGFVAKTGNLPEIEKRLSGMVEELPDDELLPKLKIDAAVDLSEMSADLAENIKTMEPFGMANPAPVFALMKGEIVDAKPVGKEGKHVKLRVRGREAASRQDGKSMSSQPGNLATLQPVMDAIAFNFGDRIGELLGTPVDVAFGLEENVWNGRTSLQLNVKDMRKHQFTDTLE